MLTGTKSTMVLTKGFNFDGKVKKYLTNLPFVEARAVFGKSTNDANEK